MHSEHTEYQNLDQLSSITRLDSTKTVNVCMVSVDSTLQSILPDREQKQSTHTEISSVQFSGATGIDNAT